MRLFTQDVEKVETLGREGDLKWSRTATGLRVKVPDQAAGDLPFVMKITPKT